MFVWSFFYATFFAVYGVWVTFGPARLLQIAPHWAAASLSASTLVYFAALPAAQWLWKRWGFAPALAAWGGVASLAYALPALTPAALPLALPVGSMAAAGAYGIAETFMIESLAAEGRSDAFGPVRRWGSLGFLMAAASGGVILDAFGGVVVTERLLAVTALGFGLGCALLVRHCLQHVPAARRQPALQGRAPAESEPVTAQAEALAVSPVEPGVTVAPQRWLLAAAGIGAIALHRVAENQTTAWFGAMWIARGHSASEAGILAAWAVAAEFLAMGAAPRFVARFGLARLLAACTAISALRWWLTPRCEQFACAAALQSVHALTFGVYYPASLLWLRNARPQDFFNARYLVEGSSRALAGGYYYLAAGTLIPALGYASAFEGCALLALLALLLWLADAVLHRKGMAGRLRAP